MNCSVLCAILLMSLLSACGGGSNSSVPSQEPTPPEIEAFTGVFVDSPVEGLRYTTDSNSGQTSAAGEFTYQSNETVVFAIGDVRFPEVLAKSTMTPLNLFSTDDINNTSVVNTLRLLQSLDTDGDLENGIQIPSAAHEVATGLNIDFSADDFDIQVETIVSMSGGANQQLVTAESAVFHFQHTLNQLNEQDIGTCSKTHPKIGYSGFFETFAHNVAGKATIVDDCTIKITQFDYDGGGPLVYFYGAINHDYEGESAFVMSQAINGREYQNEEFLLRLPDGKTLNDLTGIAVWCVEFNADFGHMEFTP